MKKIMNWVLAATLICGASVFTACSDDTSDNPVVPEQPVLNLSQNIIGKWMVSEIEGQPCPTNWKTVLTFESPTKAYGSLSDYYSLSWNERVEASVIINGNRVSVSNHDGNTINVLDCVILSISDTDMLMSSDWNVFVDGKSVQHEVYGKERYERITNDYKDAIIGLWEGRSTDAEGSEFDDGENHRWEYLADGTFRYYYKVGGLWQLSDDVLHDYFVDGTLLCTRWKNAGEGQEENREWWEIESIENDVMKWKALRMREDGSTYTATFEMKKVAIPTKEEIQQNIIGKWVTTEINGEPALTKQKFVYDFTSERKGTVCFSTKAIPVDPAPWFDKSEFDYYLFDNDITFSVEVDEHSTIFQQFTVASISANKMECVLKQIIYNDKTGLEIAPTTFCTFEKTDQDYSADIIGSWQGVSITETERYGNVEKQLWQFKSDDTYVFSMKNDQGEWVPSEDEISDYFVAGNLLCIRWKNAGEGQEEYRDWWEIESIKDGVMKWTAQRKKEDGTTYTATATFAITKVQ